MHAGARSERILAERGVVRGHGDAAVLRDERHVLGQWRKIAIDEPPQLHVDEQLIHRGVAHALADTERAAMHAVGDRRRGERVDRPEPAVVVTVVVELHVASADDLLPEERKEVAHAFRCRVPDGVRCADALRAAADRRLVEPAERLRVGARRVFGDEHDWEASFGECGDRLLDVPQHRVDRPVLGETPDR